MQHSLQTTVKILTEPERHTALESLYLALRAKEGRIYSDMQVSLLPDVPANHPLRREWNIRKHSSLKLERHLYAKGAGLHILDLGCGNGWQSNRLSMGGRNTVFGIDMNMQELRQAANVFAKNKKLHFLYADIFTAELPTQFFDAIIISSAVQYFPDVQALIQRLFQLLKSQGEIHILDSPFYHESEIEAASERSKAYYTALGFPGMAEYYHHHTSRKLANFQPKQKNFLPRTIAGRRVRLSKSPFPWYVIKKPV